MAAVNTSTLMLVSRLFWLMFGPMLLTITALVIANAAGSGWRTTADWMYLTILSLTLVARWTEYSGGGAMDGSGKPVTREHVVRYSVVTLVAGIGAWVGANLIANHLLAT